MSGGGFGHPGPGDPAFGDDAARRERLRDIHDVVGSLRQPVSAPDLTASILRRMEEERPFVDAKTRRLVWVSRLGFAASLAVAALGVALMHRAAPELLRLSHRPEPLTDVVSTAGSEVTSRLQTIRSTLTAAASRPSVRPALNLACGATIEPALAPMPPSYSATFVALSAPTRVGAAPAGFAVADAPAPPVARVPLAMVPVPRVFTAEEARPSAAMWSTGVPRAGQAWVIVQTAPAPVYTPAASKALTVRGRVVLDRLGAGVNGSDAAEPAVPR
jgi:hypothetical protein